MKVKILKETRWDDESLRPGDIIDVDGTTGNRWINHTIAEIVQESAEADSAGDGEGQAQGPTPTVDYDFESMKINDLRKLASERELPYTNNMKKAELIGLIRGNEGNDGEAPYVEIEKKSP